MRFKFVELCKDELRSNPKSFVLLGDIGVGGFLDGEGQLFQRVINMGIAEQAMVGFGSGLSTVMPGGNVILHTISPFLVERALEQIKLCAGYNKSKLILVSANGPFDYEKLGPTHHCPSDVNILSTIPNLELRVPATLDDFCESFKDALSSASSFYIRMTNRLTLIPVPSIKEGRWNKIFITNGLITNQEPESVDGAILCIGESLKYCLSNFSKGQFAIYWTSNPMEEAPISLAKYTEIKIFEPYTKPMLTTGLDCSCNVSITRKNFKTKYKKVILENLGWEDFSE